MSKNMPDFERDHRGGAGKDYGSLFTQPTTQVTGIKMLAFQSDQMMKVV